MIILGIDPGSTLVGYALLERIESPRLLSADLLPIREATPPERLKKLHHAMTNLIQRSQPDVMAVEQLFFAKNVKTAIEVSQCRGVILLTGLLAGLTVYEYTPLQVKKIVTGDGRADKLQIKKMIHLTLPETRSLKARDDVFDAIAVALACGFQTRNENKIIRAHY